VKLGASPCSIFVSYGDEESTREGCLELLGNKINRDKWMESNEKENLIFGTACKG